MQGVEDVQNFAIDWQGSFHGGQPGMLLWPTNGHYSLIQGLSNGVQGVTKKTPYF